jgi:hypothetical protein
LKQSSTHFCNPKYNPKITGLPYSFKHNAIRHKTSIFIRLSFCRQIMDSPVEEDVCGVCAGDGSTCKQRQKRLQGQIPNGSTTKLTIIPRGAWQIKIRARLDDQANLLVKERESNMIAYDGRRRLRGGGDKTSDSAADGVTLHGAFVTEGTMFNVTRSSSNDELVNHIILQYELNQK